MPARGAGPALKGKRFLFCSFFSSTIYELLVYIACVILSWKVLSCHNSFYVCYSSFSFEIFSLLLWVLWVIFVKLRNTSLPFDTMWFYNFHALSSPWNPSSTKLLAQWRLVIAVGPFKADDLLQWTFSYPCFMFKSNSNISEIFTSTMNRLPFTGALRTPIWAQLPYWKEINLTVLLLSSSPVFMKEGKEQQSIPPGFARETLTPEVLSKWLLKIEPEQTDLNSKKRTQ